MERESPLICAFSIRQFTWEYRSGKGKSTYICVFNQVIRVENICFQLGNSFGNKQVERENPLIYLFSIRQFI